VSSGVARRAAAAAGGALEPIAVAPPQTTKFWAMGTKESKHSNSISYEDSVKRGECPPVGVLCASAPPSEVENGSLLIKKNREPPQKQQQQQRQVQSIPLLLRPRLLTSGSTNTPSPDHHPLLLSLHFKFPFFCCN